ncbi:MAG: metal-dependent transcriptional regulator [Clostridiales Family XIII bacterium]|jgi:Mn-dependent DtxR family transcriptional regulator|nr:metal-dependent transcriptional regulator [Clostridiales Family XIII bacterium]
MKIRESGENYLETILILKRRNGSVRSVDIATELDYSKPSISRAVGILKREGYITVDRDGNVEFTDIGKRTAENIYERHTMIAEYLNKALDVDKDVALEDSCRIEHVISEQSFDKMKSWLKTNA